MKAQNQIIVVSDGRIQEVAGKRMIVVEVKNSSTTYIKMSYMSPV